MDHCRIRGCKRPVYIKKRRLCSPHYHRARRDGTLGPSLRSGGTCTVEECADPATRRGWCGKHYERWRSWGDPLGRPGMRVFWDGDGRVCTGCGTYKPWEEYTSSRGGTNDRRSQCKPCTSELRASRYAQRTEAERVNDRTRHREWDRASDRHLRRRYGLTRADYEAKVVAQGNRCAICGEEPFAKLVVDHDHLTNQVRDLLCNGCNVLLGQIEARPGIVDRIHEYMAKHDPARGLV